MRTAAMLASSALAAAIGIGLALHLRRRMMQSVLESTVERPPSPLKRAGKKAVLAGRAIKGMKQRASQRRSVPESGYLAFVSHMKVEAAMEARFIQIELETLHPDELVFLDSDDLRDLTKLIHHVKSSRCLILVQTRKVLTRPYCIIEILTAIECRIPIVCVTVAGKPNDAYSFDEMAQMMMWMDSELEQWNPGAADVLRDHGYDDLTYVAYQLSTVVPKTISVSLNTGASRNMLRATIEDVVSSVDEARGKLLDDGDSGRDVPDQAAWLAARDKMTRPAPRPAAVPSPTPVYAHGSAPPTAPAGTAAPTAAVAPLAGRGLINAAATSPALLPLAFAIQALASGAKAAFVKQSECALAAAAAEPLERLILAAAPHAPPDALHQVNVAVEGLAALQVQCAATKKGDAAVAEPSAGAFEQAQAALVKGVAELSLAVGSAEGRAAASDLARALQGLPVTPPPPPLASAAPTSDALQASHAQAEAARQQRELLEMQNKVLMEQVQQMQAMMAQQQLSMQSFMAKFPQPADEPERRLVLLKKRLMEAPNSDFARVDDVLSNLIISGALGAHCRAVMFNVVGDDCMRGLSVILALEDGRMLTTPDMPSAMLAERQPRKASMCQYVVATGEYQCFTKHGQAGKCFMMDFMKNGVNMMDKDPEMHAMLESLKEADPQFAEGMKMMKVCDLPRSPHVLPNLPGLAISGLPISPMSSSYLPMPSPYLPGLTISGLPVMKMMEPMMASANDLQEMPTVRRLSTKLQRALISGAVTAASGTNAGQFMGWMMTTMCAEDLTYIGAPVMAEGRTMGSLCTLFTGGAAEGPGDDIRQKLERAAARLSDVLDAM